VGARVIRLEQNYRSTQNILKVASTVVANNTERKGKTLWTENPSGDLITCRRSRSARLEAEWACRRIAELLEAESAWRVAVLYRANFLSRNYEEVLVQRGIPYAVVGSVAFFGRMEVKDMLGYLRVIYNPEDDVALLRVINTPARGIGTTAVDLIAKTAIDAQIPMTEALRRLASDPPSAGRAARALQRFLELLDGWCAMRDTASPEAILESVLEKTDYRKMLEKAESASEAEDRLANIDELLRAAAESSERGETVFEFLDRAVLSSELDALDPNARVALMTLHSAKGLEFDAVFLAGLEEGLFPHSHSSGSLEEIEEERRLCYVGVTRARRKLYLLWTPFRRSFGSEASIASLPSRFLEEMPADLVEGLEDSLAPHFDGEQRRGSFWIEDEEDDFEEEDELEEEEEQPAAVPLRRAQGPEPKTLAELREYVARQQAAPGPVAALKAGARVRHTQFGDGIIVSRQRSGNDFKLVVHFSRVGRKTLIERFARLQLL
jgi:DNA helicase-2/ATP-dependent DNA helicase PcrA